MNKAFIMKALTIIIYMLIGHTAVRAYILGSTTLCVTIIVLGILILIWDTFDENKSY